MLRYLRSIIASLGLLAVQAFAAAPCPTISVGPLGPLPGGAQQIPYSATFTASGSSATPYGFQITSGLPTGSGLSINPSTGVLSGTPTLDGLFHVTITARDQNGCTGGRRYELDIRPAVLDTVPANGAGGVPATSNVKIDFTESVHATATAFALECPTGTPIAYTVSPALPADASTFTLTPNANLPANVACTGSVVAQHVTATASPNLHPAADYSFTFSTGSLPTITSANVTTFTVGTSGTFTVTTTGTPAPSITRGGVALPSGVTFTDNGNGTGTLAGNPAVGTGGTYAITFTANNSSGSSPTQSFTLTINEAASITSANATSFAIGTAGTFSVTTTGYPKPTITRGGVALPSNVTFTDNGNGTGTLAGTPATGTGGTYAITFTATNGVGGPANQNFTFSVVGATSTTALALTTGTNPSVYGQSLTFTATVSGSGGTPTGTVTFTEGVTTLGTGTLNGSGQATFTTSTLGAGGHAITAVYGGDSNFANSTSAPLGQTVNQASTTTVLTTSKSPTVFGEAVTFTATVAPIAPGAGTPTGTVTFTDATTATTLGTGSVNGSGQATLSTSALTTGAHTITATYGGNSNFASSSGGAGQTVNQGATTTAVATTVNPSVYGQSVTFTATVTPTAPSFGTPTGTVTFQDGGGTIGSGPVNGSGQATFTTSALSVASHSITAIYSGDTNFTTSTSAALTQTVNQAATTTLLTSSVNPSTISQSVTFTATVAAVSPGAGLPTGTVTFNDGATFLASVALNASAQATFATSTLNASSHSITAVYSGDANFITSTGGPLSQAVNLNASTTTLTSSQNASVFGQSVTLTATVSGSAGTATGTVDFLDNGSPIATNVALVAGVATLTTGTLSVGSHPLTAVYSGDATYGGSTSSILTQTVNQADTTTTVTADNNPSLVGETVTFTITVAAVLPGAGTPTGTITALTLDGTTTLAPPPTLTLDGSGQVTFATNTIPLGSSHTITATYSGDVNFLASDNSASPLTQQVDQASTTTTLGTSGSPSVFGQSVTFTATVTAVAPGGGTPTGTVTFKDGGSSIGTGTLAGGTATFSTSSLSVGSHSITADYAVTPSYAASSTAAPTTQQVNKADTTTAVVSSLNPSKTGDSVTFTATVTATSPGVGTPTGTVTFNDSVSGSLGSGTLNGSGQATVSTSALTAGAHTITASYGGDANFNVSTSSGLTQNVNQPPAITSANNTTFAPGKVGQTFTVTTTGFPTGASMGISQTGTVPSGVIFTNNNDGTATIHGTPAALTQNSSPYPWTITANNGITPNATQSFTLNIACPLVSVSGASTLSAVFNTAMTPAGYSQVGGNGTITWTAPGLPSGVSIDSSGNISGTPSATGVFSVTVTATDAGGCQGTEAVTFTSAPSAVGDSYSGMIDNTQAVVTGGSTASPGTPFIALTGSLLANDLPSGGVAATAGTFATTGGGSVTIAADGTFIYTPKANSGAAANTSDSFTYTVTSNGATSAAATVNLTLSNRIWYVNNNGGGSTGQSQSPFTTLAAAGAASTANDFIFVYNGNGTNSGQNAGITLKNGQQLLGEANGLTVGALTIAAGSRPTIGNSGGDGVTITNVTGVVVKGLAVAGSTNAINMSSSAANALTATVDNVVVNNAGAIGIRINDASTGAATLTVQNSTVSAATGNGIDARTAAGGTGGLVLDIDNNAVTSSASGIVIDGSAAGATTITGFANNAIGGNTVGSGILVTSATFDATPGGTFQTVSGGTTVIGTSGNGVGAAGMVLTSVSGDLGFTDLDIFTSAGAGLQASGTTPYTGSAGFQIAVSAGVATITAVGGPAVNLSTVRANNLPLLSISSTSSPTTGVALNSLLGSFSAGSGSSISSTTGTGFQVGSSNATITYDGTLNTTTGKGVDLTNNTGSTISFTGALALSSGTNTAFNATGGGTISASASGSTLTSTSGTALNVANTTIGASGLKFQSITAGTGAGSAGNGIVLDTTGATGGLTVTGTGSVGSGGTIQHKTGADLSTAGIGIYLKSTSNVSLSWMQLNDFDNFAIYGTGVNNLAIDRMAVSGTNGNNSADDEGSVAFGYTTVVDTSAGLTGSVTVTNSNFGGGSVEDTFRVRNGSGSLNRITMTNDTFASLNPIGDALKFETVNTGVINATIQNSFFTSAAGDLFNFLVNGTSADDLVFTGNALTNNNPAIATGGGGVTISGNGTSGGDLTFNVSNNTMRDADGHAALIVKSTGPASFSGTFAGNAIGVAATADSGSKAGDGLKLQNAGGGTVTASITNNQIFQYNNFGIEMETGGGATAQSGTMNTTITGNTISNPGTGGLPMNGIHLNAGTVPGDTYNVCTKIGGAGALANSITGSGANGGTDFRLRQRQSTTVRLPGYGGANNDNTAVVTFEQGNNGGASGLASNTVGSGGGGFVGSGTTCP